MSIFNLKTYQFELPQELIAQFPCTPRDRSRLMIVDRKRGIIDEILFCEIGQYLNAGDQLIFNDTKVIPARLIGKREGGQKEGSKEAEVFLIRRQADGMWDALVRPGRKLPVGARVEFGPGFSCEVVLVHDDGSRRVKFDCVGDFETALTQYGQIPLPQYIRRTVDRAFDPERYQTVYAAQAGAVAAPTAGLHFTEELLKQLDQQKVERVHLTLHVGLGTFRPVQVDDIRQHVMHAEQYFITPQAALGLQKDVRRRICVGTTSCRALESLPEIREGSFETNIFIYPGYTFKRVDALLTNFHLPGSSLLMLVSAFAGYDLIREAYAQAIAKKFRFFSYGDAMLII